MDERVARFYAALGTTLSNGKTLNESLKIGSFPVWWFYQRRFIRDDLPPQLDNHQTLLQKSGFHHNLFSQVGQGILGLYTTTKRKMMARLFLYNYLQKHNPRSVFRTSDKPVKIAVLLHSNAIHRDGSIDRINPLLQTIASDDLLSWLPVTVDPLAESSRSSQQRNDLAGTNHLSGFVTPEIRAQGKEIASSLFQSWLEFENSVNPHQIELWRAAAQNLSFYFSKPLFRVLAELYLGFKNALQTLNVRGAMVYALGGPECRAFIAAAYDLSIPLFVVPHGLIIPQEQWDMPDNVYFFAPNEPTRSKMISLGAPPERITVTGSITLTLPQPTARNPDAPVLFMTQNIVEESYGSEEEYLIVVEKIVRAVTQTRPIVIKPHPCEDVGFSYPRRFERFAQISGVTIAPSRMPKSELNTLIDTSSSVVTFVSTAVLDGLLAKRPVFLLSQWHDALGGKDIYPLLKHPALFQVRDTDDLVSSLKKLRESTEELFTVLPPYVFLPPEGVAQKMMGEINLILRQNTKHT